MVKPRDDEGDACVISAQIRVVDGSALVTVVLERSGAACVRSSARSRLGVDKDYHNSAPRCHGLEVTFERYYRRQGNGGHRHGFSG